MIRQDELPETALAAVPYGPVEAEIVRPDLSARVWTLRPSTRVRRARLVLLQARTGRLSLRDDEIVLAAPAIVWLPAGFDGILRLDAGAHGQTVSVAEDFLVRTVAASAEAVHLRRTLDRLVLIGPELSAGAADEVARSCEALAREVRHPDRGGAILLAAHVSLLCLQVWRLAARSGSASDETGLRGAGALLLERFRQLLELHYRDGWQVRRYAATLGVTEDRLHAACLKAAGKGPRALLHERLVEESRARLRQLDLPVEQIGYGLGFRDPGYFSRFIRRHLGASPGAYRRQARLEESRRSPTYAAWP
jgi:AraC family transcriptional activator of pobA